MKSVIFYCRLHELPETMLANLREKCQDAGRLKCYGECPWRGIRIIGPI